MQAVCNRITSLETADEMQGIHDSGIGGNVFIVPDKWKYVVCFVLMVCIL